MIGIPGSGKTTYVRETLPKHSHISLDINRKSISPIERHILLERYDNEKTLHRSKLSNSRKCEYVQIHDALTAGRDVVVDNTNTTRKIRRPYVKLARMHGADIRAVFFYNIKQAYIRNAQREKKPNEERLPDKVLDEKRSELEIPHRNEGFGSIKIIK